MSSNTNAHPNLSQPPNTHYEPRPGGIMDIQALQHSVVATREELAQREAEIELHVKTIFLKREKQYTEISALNISVTRTNAEGVDVTTKMLEFQREVDLYRAQLMRLVREQAEARSRFGNAMEGQRSVINMLQSQMIIAEEEIEAARTVAAEGGSEAEVLAINYGKAVDWIWWICSGMNIGVHRFVPCQSLQCISVIYSDDPHHCIVETRQTIADANMYGKEGEGEAD
ncbi:hypothetical protein BCR34DRAFT_583318 [Clohesyomyces aquaticus]|uniref:Uncharacterized protein n=1 Tax=Clohesyomyces aquaticus TaxID=1231657 RepID=A0A1Y2A5G8_9PLEO|nr:hypothetical protein BCR34DRAFT_583318 [Clohesyomyces aquaticus]